MESYELKKMRTQRYRNLKEILKVVYGYDNFRSKQYEIINRIINGEDVCAIMPTGMGKSLCFQIPALYMDGVAIIVSPLISLMDDQRIILEKLNITSCCYNSNVVNRTQMENDIMCKKYQFVYITPESIIKKKDMLENMYQNETISLIAIDEAHCISSYGFDFRPAYRELSFLKTLLPNVPILALTATATRSVGTDICNVLQFNKRKLIMTSFDRPNLYLQVRKKNKKIDDDIVPIIKRHPDSSIIIYCVTKKHTEKVASILQQHNIGCGVYHAGMDSDDRTSAHNNFLSGDVKVIAATIAFGMGINKGDVRVVIHYGSPKSIEGYYQEIGRAGRDGLESYCYAFYNAVDFRLQESFIINSNNQSYQKIQRGMLASMKKYMETTHCRRKVLLEYFEEEYNRKCNKCDNCCNVVEDTPINLKTSQNIWPEAKLLIDTILSLKDKTFGLIMYINILRGSSNKKITAPMKKSKFYGKGKHRSMEWWKEMASKLESMGYLRNNILRGFACPIQIIKVTSIGINFSHQMQFNVLEGGEMKLPNVEMQNTI